MALVHPAPLAQSPLAVYRPLSRKAGIRVSPLCLGGLPFGEAWKKQVGGLDWKASFELLDYFYEQGGNFIDTANAYQLEESEKIIGEWMSLRGNRDEMVIATKYSTCFTEHNGFDGSNQRIHVNNMGASAKSLHVSFERSLKKLKTDYVDLLYVHWWDYDAPIEEVMQALNNLVRAGKVLYLGISDTPAWIVARANQYARDHGLAEFVAYQGGWSAAERDFERDIIPMSAGEGMAILPWGALGGGLFKTEEERQRSQHIRGGMDPPAKVKGVCKVLESVAKRHQTKMTSIALAYVAHKAPDVYPIVGARTVKQLQENIDALLIELSDDDIKEIETGYGFEMGFPQKALGPDANNMFLKKAAGQLISHPLHLPIRPAQIKPFLAANKTAGAEA